MIMNDLAQMTRAALIAFLLLTLAVGCADREQIRAKQVADETAAAGEDDATCRPKGAPGTPGYDNCRKELAQARAARSAVQYQKQRDFDRTLGAGTSDAGGSY
jgi:hypothetical protein